MHKFYVFKFQNLIFKCRGKDNKDYAAIMSIGSNPKLLERFFNILINYNTDVIEEFFKTSQNYDLKFLIATILDTPDILLSKNYTKALNSTVMRWREIVEIMNEENSVMQNK